VQDFLENPKLELTNLTSSPWMNPDQNRSASKLLVYSFSVLVCYFIAPSPETLTWAQSFFPSSFMFLFVSTYVIGLFAFWIPTFTYYTLYYLNLPGMEKYKVDKSAPWDWNTRKMITEFAHVMFGNMVYGPPTLFCSMYVFNTIDTRPETTPLWYVNIFWLYIGALVFEVCFYWFHRLAHSIPWIYDNIHKTHHDMKPCYGLGSMYHHPLDSVLTQWTPFHLAGCILRLHVTTYLSLSFLLTMIGVDEHSGYSFPFSPFRLFYGNADPDFHYFHHTHGAMGNYAAPLMDWIFGSDKAFRGYLLEKQKRLSDEAQAIRNKKN